MSRARSSSSSTSGSSSSGSSSSSSASRPAPAPAATVPSSAQPQRNAPMPYKPEPGYGAAALAEMPHLQGGQELWAVRVPDGVRPRDLDGLVLSLPKGAHGADLATLPLNGTTYALRSLAPQAPSSAAPAGGAPGVGAGKGNEQSTQLIAMAAGAGAARQEDASADGPVEMRGFTVLLPSQGKLKATKQPVAQHLHLVALPPKLQGAASPAARKLPPLPPMPPMPIAAGTKRRQPEHKLGGFFKPAGSNTSSDGPPAHKKAKTAASPAPAAAASVSPEKKQAKLDKKVEKEAKKLQKAEAKKMKKEKA